MFTIRYNSTEPITAKQRGYLVALYKKKGIFRELPDTKLAAIREIDSLTGFRNKKKPVMSNDVFPGAIAE